MSLTWTHRHPSVLGAMGMSYASSKHLHGVPPTAAGAECEEMGKSTSRAWEKEGGRRMEGGSKGRGTAREGWELARILAIHLAQGRMHAPIWCFPAAVG